MSIDTATEKAQLRTSFGLGSTDTVEFGGLIPPSGTTAEINSITTATIGQVIIDTDRSLSVRFTGASTYEDIVGDIPTADIALNTAKVGITPAQADAIVDNTAARGSLKLGGSEPAIAVADASAMQVIIDAGSVEVGQLFSLVSDRSIRRFEGGNASRVISDLPQANPTGYATLVSVATAAKTHSAYHDGTDGATGICYSIDGGTPVYRASGAGVYCPLQNVPHNNGAPFTMSIWPTDYVGSNGAVTSAAPRAGNLTQVSLTYNAGITSMDASGLAALTHLSCGSGNLLTSLDVSGLTALTSVNCDSNQLTSLDVSGLTALTFLSFGGNPINNVDVSGSPQLDYLGCSDTDLTSLDISGLTALTQLYASRSQLTSILATGVSITYFYYNWSSISDNNLSEAALIAFVGSLATTTTGQIYYGSNAGSAAFETWLTANPTLDKGYIWINGSN